MTWSAQEVLKEVKERVSRFKPYAWRDSRSSSTLPEIASIVGDHKFLRLADRYGIIDSYFGLPVISWVLWGILTLASAFAFYIADYSLKVFSKEKTWEVLQTPWFYLGVAAVFLSKHLYDYIRNRQVQKSKAEATQDFCETDFEKCDPAAVDAFADALANKVRSHDEPRIIIIDNFDHLSLWSKTVLKHYFRAYSSSCSSSEFWIVFEKHDGERFSALTVAMAGNRVFETHKNYGQIELDREERLELAKFIGRPERAEYSRVKLICGYDNADEVHAFLRQYRREHPAGGKMYGSLELFYLLSFSSLHDTEYSALSWLVSKLADKSASRNKVLGEILRGTRFALDEFRNGIAHVREEFAPLLREGDDNQVGGFRLQANDNIRIVELADGLELPRPEICHLFWARLIWDQIQSRPPESFWMRRLSHHLLHAGATSLTNEDTYSDSVNALFAAMLRCSDNCLRTALFNRVKPLLERGQYLLSESYLVKPESKRSDLLAVTINAYSVLGDESLFELILSNLSQREERSAEFRSQHVDPLAVFLESTPLPHPVRPAAMPSVLESIPGDPDLQASIRDYARVRGLWFAFTAAPFLTSHLESLILTKSIVKSTETLTYVFDRTIDRIERLGIGTSPADMLTLSLCVWLEAMAFDRSIRRWQYLNNAGDELGIGNIVNQLTKLIDHIESLLIIAHVITDDSAEDASGKTKRTERITSIRRDFLTESLLHELGGTALSSVLLALCLTQEGAVVPKDLLKRLQLLMSEIGEVLGRDIESISVIGSEPSSSCHDSVQRYFNISRTLWHAVGLQHLHDQVNIRRTAYGLLTDETSFDTAQSLDSLVFSLRTTLEDITFVGLLANLLMANVAREVQELRCLYLSRIADFGNGKSIGSTIRNELAALCFFSASEFSQFSRGFARRLVGGNGTNGALLLSFFRCAEESEYEGLLLKMMHLIAACGDPELSIRGHEILASLLNDVESDEVRREIALMRDYLLLRDRLRNGESVDLDDVTRQWEENKASKWYIGILRQVFENGDSKEEALRECLDVLCADPDTQTYNHYYLLSQTAAEHVVLYGSDPRSRKRLVRHLSSGYRRFSGISSIRSRMETMGLLSQLDTISSDEYELEHQRLVGIKTEVDHIKQYPNLAKAGKYYLIFEDYFRTLYSFGMPCDVDPRDVRKAWRLSDHEKLDSVVRWAQEGGATPAPIKTQFDFSCISGAFLILGDHLFSKSLFPVAEYDSYRSNFNRAAHADLQKLLGIILGLSSLPTGISQIIRKWGQELQIVRQSE